MLQLTIEEKTKNIFRCPECDSLIFLSIKGAEVREDRDYVELLSTKSQPDISLIHSILDDSGLDFYITGENLLSLWTGTARVFIATDQVDQSKELLKDFETHLFGLSNQKTDDE